MSDTNTANSPPAGDSEPGTGQRLGRGEPRELRRATRGVWLALVIGSVAGLAVGINGALSLRHSFADGRSLAEALFGFLRYFTILTNIYVAALMAVTVARRGRGLPSAGAYAAATTYAIVTGVTYELLLRGLWSPHGLQFDTDLMLHDIVPVLTVVFWLFFAPKRGLRLRDAVRCLVFPVAYFSVTLIAGAWGAGYPYDFLDVGRLGYPAVLITAVMFLAFFFILAVLLTVIGRMSRAPDAATPSETSEALS